MRSWRAVSRNFVYLVPAINGIKQLVVNLKREISSIIQLDDAE